MTAKRKWSIRYFSVELERFTFQLFIAIERSTTPVAGDNTRFGVSDRCWNSEAGVRLDQLSFHGWHLELIGSIVECDGIHRYDMAEFASPRISRNRSIEW
jgi:hypothetical protein